MPEVPDVAPRLRRTSPGWAVWGLPVGLRGYVLGLPVTAVAVAAWLLAHTGADGADARLAALLLAAGALSVEASRRVGRPSGTLVKDLLSAWWLPIAVLLPPLYVLLAPVPLLALAQCRVHTTLLHRRVFSAACIGLSYAAVSIGFHALVPGRLGPVPGPGLPRWALAVAAAGVLGAAVNAGLIAAAVTAADPQARWRDLLGDPENLRLEAVEICVGVTVAVLMGLAPVLIVFMLPPVLMLQRGLLHAQLRAVAMLDGKTGLLNAPAWEREAAGSLLALRRAGHPCSVLLLDIDHFKHVNDSHGHLAGDQVLRAVAAALTAGVRAGDLLGRFGGEEFVALLPGADGQETDVIAERVRARIAGLRVPLDGGQIVSVTVSIGVAATRTSDLSVLDLLAAADRHMYQGQGRGPEPGRSARHGQPELTANGAPAAPGGCDAG